MRPTRINTTSNEQRQHQRELRRNQQRARRNSMTEEQRERERERARANYQRRTQNQRNERLQSQRNLANIEWRYSMANDRSMTSGTTVDIPSDDNQVICLPIEEFPDLTDANSFHGSNNDSSDSSDSDDDSPFQDEDLDHGINIDDYNAFKSGPSNVISGMEGEHIETDINISFPVDRGSSSHATIPRQRRITKMRRHNCARNFVDSPNSTIHRLPQPRSCPWCQAKPFYREPKGLCCKNGSVKYPPLQAPTELMQLYTTQSHEGVHFRQNIRAYNHVFSFTSMELHIDNELANAREGIYTYRAQGSIYHRIGSLLPNTEERPRYLQLYIYIYDTDHELENRMAENDQLDRRVMSIIQTVLNRDNPYVHKFRQAAERLNLEDIQILIRDNPTGGHQYNMPTTSQVAAILVGDEDPNGINERDIVVQRLTGELENIPDTTSYYDPLQYPILHPYGHSSWYLHTFSDNGSQISCREYYSYMLQIRQNEPMLLLSAGRLLQQYAVDNSVKISSQRLRYIRDHQHEIRAD